MWMDVKQKKMFTFTQINGKLHIENILMTLALANEFIEFCPTPAKPKGRVILC